MDATDSQAATSTAATNAAPPTAGIEQTPKAASLAELTQAVRKYSVEQRRVPKTLEELAAQGYLTAVPPAPAGKKFVINRNLQVELEDR